MTLKLRTDPRCVSEHCATRRRRRTLEVTRQNLEATEYRQWRVALHGKRQRLVTVRHVSRHGVPVQLTWRQRWERVRTLAWKTAVTDHTGFNTHDAA
jgi:hypothetical protein